MPKKILIPLDGSKLGETALHYVEDLIITLSAEDKMEITLIQVLPPLIPHFPVNDGELPEIHLTEGDIEPMKEEALAYLDQAGKTLRDKGVIVKCKVLVGHASFSSAEEIIKVEDDMNADLVAMSTHGRRGLSRWIFGSNTEKVLRAGNVPVLVVRAGKLT